MRSFFLAVFVGLLTCGCRQVETDKKGGPKKEAKAEQDIFYPEPAYLPGGIADETGKIGFLANPKRGIDAVDLESGKVLWHSDEASRPLVIYKQRLIALDRRGENSTRVVVLSLAEKGKQTLVSEPIRQLVPSARPTSGWGWIREGQLHLDWDGGQGSAHVSLTSGKVTEFPRKPVARGGPSVKYAEIARIAADPDALGPRNWVPKALLKPLEDPQPRDALKIDEDARSKEHLAFRKRWITGNTLAVLMSKDTGRRWECILIGWDLKTGKNLRTFSVAAGHGTRDSSGGTTVLHVTDQGRYLVIDSIRNEHEKGPKTDRRIFIVSAESGRQLYKLSLKDWFVDPWAVGPRLFYEAEGKLRAIDMATERLLWEIPIGEWSKVADRGD